ncbi:unnamed protein product [Mytilus coruscus]|uniref:Uncharacterized protein n=1 Tax=Mytilus coruscus TaxID=42192 RepID=A0A6J8AUJ7_MYTCO|nr:unnamed protein product [Mytilus coruscus]
MLLSELFIPEQVNNKILLCVLESIKYGGIDVLINNLFAPVHEDLHLSNTDNETSSIMLDSLRYRILRDVMGGYSIKTSITRYYKGLVMADSLLKSETSTFIIENCKHYIDRISKKLAEKLPPPNTKGETYSLRQCYYKLLQNCIKTDSVSGWLLYASYYYVTRQYDATLKLTDYILSKWSPDMILIGSEHNTNEGSYRHNVHSTMTLNENMTLFTKDDIQFVPNSSLIPEELQLEVKDHIIQIQPVFMAHCLRLLCYHHLGDIPNRRHALRDLYLTVNVGPFTSEGSLSSSLTIFGVCYEISEYKDKAYQCYIKSLQYIKCKCSTAEIRKSKLFDI